MKTTKRDRTYTLFMSSFELNNADDFFSGDMRNVLKNLIFYFEKNPVFLANVE